ncbi:MAG TPA: hypothetical protein VMQ52_00120 [Candidatus Saccharimonadales bacterium]|jgi:hypothetical protein|nr:hypothetical protein [Candidatus Saccharimonadales bacterium]
MKNIFKRWRFYIAVVLVVIFGASTTIISSVSAVNTTISSDISPVISLFTTSGTVNDAITPTGSGAQTIQSDTVTVSTNDSSGYTLQLAESSATTTLTSGSNTIPASSGSQTTPVVMAVNTWGYRVDSLGGFGSTTTTAASNAAISGTIKFAGVPAPASPNTLADTSGTASNAVTTVWYGVAANTTQPSGTYTNTVTYTATTN